MAEDSFPLEKILNVTMNDYTSSKGLNFEQYVLVGVHSHGDSISDFAYQVPENAEIVVNYQHIFFGAGGGNADVGWTHHQMGTALIRKK